MGRVYQGGVRYGKRRPWSSVICERNSSGALYVAVECAERTLSHESRCCPRLQVLTGPPSTLAAT